MTELPPSVRLEPGAGALPRLVVTTPAATAEVYLQGAQVTSWRPAGHDDVLWLSGTSRFAAGSAIRGGVPLCFPWFGAHATDPDAPSHGFARLSSWSLDEAREDGDDVVLVLSLADSPETRASAWPHAFRASLRVTVGATLRLDLTVHNRDTRAVTLEEALHTYLRVSDVRQARVTGLERSRYLDKLGGPEPVPGTDGPVVLTGATDRIYLDPTGTTTVDDPAGGRRTTVHAQASGTTVLWNPWAERAAAMADVEDGGWTRMLCVETSNVGPAALTLEPDAAHTMSARFEVTGTE